VCVCRSNLHSTVEASDQSADVASDTEDGSAVETGGAGSGPRIKHVCRYQSIALGKPLATFPPVTSSQLQLSALPSQEKERILVEKAPGAYVYLMDLRSTVFHHSLPFTLPYLPLG